ncbi:ATP-binding protein [candidate division KSB1 bacterium]|nr:ATP-binding protein [candidate division KSB1 bacterium]
MKKAIPPEIPNQIKRIQPRYLILISILLVLALFSSGWYELQQTRREIRHILQEEAATLIEAVSISGANAIQAFAEIEKLVEERLFSVAHVVDDLDQLRPLTRAELGRLVQIHGIYRVNLFDAHGKMILSNLELPPQATDTGMRAQYIQPILNGQVEELVLGFRDSRHPGEKRFAVAIKRKRGGAIVANIQAEALLEFRKTFGVGRLIQDLGDHPDIQYIVLQDFEGIILASHGVTQMEPIASDSFLVRGYHQAATVSRLQTSDQGSVFEMAKSFQLNDEPVGLFRIGLKTTHLDEASQRTQRRFLIMSLVLGFFMVIMVNFITISQNYHLINLAYQRIQTYSRNILEHMADAVIALDQDRRVLLFNRAAAELFKLPIENVVNHPVPEPLTRHVPILEAAFEKGTTVRELELSVQIDQQRFILAISTSVLRKSTGEIDSVFAVVRNLTEQRQLETALRLKEKLTAMGQLAAGVAHEIRNPLNAIAMISQRLNREFVPQTDVTEYQQLTQVVVNEVRRIDRIIQQFLQFARPPALNQVATDLNQLLESILVLMRNPAEQKGITIVQEFKPLPAVLLDPNQVQQAVINLIQNSLEAIDGPGQIHLRTQLNASGEIVLEVQDTGRGIPEEIRPKIFNLYFTTKSTGTGLGLSLVYQIISQHNGRITVTSEVGQGTTFSIFLPVVPLENT